MKRRSKMFIAAGATALVAAAAGTGVAVAGGGDDDSTEVSIKGDSALERASAAALDYAGGGTVTSTEEGDEESYYEIEVRRDDGSVVDVQLDKSFQVVGTDPDDDGVEDEN